MSGLQARVVISLGDSFTLDIELAIAGGETVALLGPNGAGKSTTVDALAGITPLAAGQLILDGRVLDDPSGDAFVPPERRDIGVVFQDYLLFDHLSVFDNVMFGIQGRSNKREARSVVGQWLELLDLNHLGDRRPPELSGGQAQRVALARALANEPAMLLLDEALAALDVGTRNELRRVLARHLREFSGPRLLITHDPTDAFLLADRIAILEAGRITQIGSAEDIRRRPASTYVAALAGTNLLVGHNDHGVLTLDGHDHRLQTSDTSVVGGVLITIHPTAIALHRAQPSGSPRNTWRSTVESVEPLGDTTRITLADPLPLGVDITPAATAALNLAPGVEVWASVKATEIDVSPVS